MTFLCLIAAPELSEETVPKLLGIANLLKVLKDDAYFCYCAYVLRISRYSGFPWVVPTNTRIFLRGLKLCRESRT